jgi:hypothetical protein
LGQPGIAAVLAENNPEPESDVRLIAAKIEHASTRYGMNVLSAMSDRLKGVRKSGGVRTRGRKAGPPSLRL